MIEEYINPEIIARLATAFRPHAPIEDPNSFVGHEKERTSVYEAIYQPGLQVIIFGERGAGKTSLANVCTDKMHRVRVFAEKDASFSAICKNITLGYKEIVPPKMKYNALSDSIEIDGSIYYLNNMVGNDLRKILPKSDPLCVIIDEIDRLSDKSVVAQLAELAKNLSTYQTNITLILAGVATTANELLEGHASNFRNLRQVSLDRMPRSELLGIISHGEEVLSIKFSEDVKLKIAELCDNLPYYLHLIATNAAQAAINRNSQVVDEEDLVDGIGKADSDADQSLREDYEHSIMSPKRSEIYRQVLWAMANLPGKAYTVATVAEELNKISIKETGKRMSVPLWLPKISLLKHEPEPQAYAELEKLHEAREEVW